jgi:hypothetical protein
MDSTTFLGEEIQTELATRPNTELRNRKTRMEEYTKDRDDLMTPSTLTAAYICSNAGTDLDAIEPFTTELTGIVDTMKEALANETRLLEGTEVPEYTPLTQNELSDSETKEEQWTNGLRNGSSTIVPIHISTPVSSTSSSTARPSSPVSDTHDSERRSLLPQIAFSLATSAVSGYGIDATNECSECTVPMISEPTPGTQSEAK